jgi:hypothetical protein
VEDTILLVIKNPSTKNDKHYENTKWNSNKL